MEKTNGEKLICESCAKEFSCGAKTGKCWCFEMELPSETLEKLREDFKKCLCQDCLGKLAVSGEQ